MKFLAMHMCALKEAATLGYILLRLWRPGLLPYGHPLWEQPVFFSRLPIMFALPVTTRYTNKLLILDLILYLYVHQA